MVNDVSRVLNKTCLKRIGSLASLQQLNVYDNIFTGSIPASIASLQKIVLLFDMRCDEQLGYGLTFLLAMLAIKNIAVDALPTCSKWLWTESISTISSLFAGCCVIMSSCITHLYYK